VKVLIYSFLLLHDFLFDSGQRLFDHLIKQRGDFGD
jgi:hypothetical protein